MSSNLGSAWAPSQFPFLTSSDSHIPLDKPHVSYLVLLSYFIVMIFAPVACSASDRYGRKPTMMFQNAIGIVSAFCLVFGTSKTTLVIARILHGIQHSGDVILGAYVTEISHVTIRTRLMQLYTLSITLGFLLMYLAALFLTFHQIAVLMVALPFGALVLNIWIPESPYYHAMKNDYESTRKSLTNLGYTDVSDEISTIKKSLTSKQDTIGWRDFISNRGVSKAFGAAFFIVCCQYMSGVLPVIIYAQNILNNDCHAMLTPAIAILLMQLFSSCSQFSSVLFSSWLGVKIIYFASTLMAGVSMLALAGFFFFNDVIMTWYPRAACTPFILLAIFHTSMAPGLLGLSWPMIHSFFPMQYKRMAITLLIFIAQVLSFVMLLTFEIFQHYVNMAAGFAFFGLCTIVNAFLVIRLLPETSKKKLLEVYEWFGIDMSNDQALTKV